MEINLVCYIAYLTSGCCRTAKSVSSLPLQNGSWTLLTATGYQISLAKEGSKKNEPLVPNVAIYQIPEFSNHEQSLSHISQGRAAEPNMGRFEVQKNEESLSPLYGVTCAKYHSISRDKNAQIQGGGTRNAFRKFGISLYSP